ncbi:MAG TPA: carboxylesterase, partial [Burkholderiales bacterium]|nr:carboxylesterase [Burkholderiales bacterium]
IALQAGLRYPETLAGVMALSCYLPCSDSFAAEASAANAKTPLLIAHGTQDPVVPYAMGKNSADMLVKSGYAVEWREYPMQHSLCLEEVRDIGMWITRVLRA